MRGRSRAKRLFNNIIASDEDVQRIWTMYVQYFNAQGNGDGTADIIPEFEGGNDDDGLRECWNQTDDLGVGAWSYANDDNLNKLLGYKDGRPALFAKCRSKSGKSAWDTALTDNSDLFDLHPMWHQKVGVAAMASLLWTKEECQAVPGILLADKVGLGKSAQVMMLIDLIIEMHMAEEIVKEGKPAWRPPLLGECSANLYGVYSTAYRKQEVFCRKDNDP
jgi:hypothetical protein